MDFLSNALPNANGKNILWKYDDKPELYNIYCQYIEKSDDKYVEKSEPIQEKSEPVQEKSEPIQEKSEHIQEKSEHIQEKSEPIQEKSEHIQEKSEHIQEKSEPIKALNNIIQKPVIDNKNNMKKNKKHLPYDIIIQLSDNHINNLETIKNMLTEFISSKDFQKIFGVKKSSEIMSGLTNNKWNKSLVLFLSFIFNVSFVYLNKDVAYGEYTTKIVL